MSDTGTGIAADEVPRLFERFHRIQGARSRTHEGTGIGLALVQELARMHGGQISVHSEQGLGSTFTVRIPTGTSHLPADKLSARRSLTSTALSAEAFLEESLRWSDASAAVAATSVPAPGSGADRPRILVADDNADMREYLTRLLGPQWTVEAVTDGAAALAAAVARPPDLVLSDVMMPNVDGFELLKRLREHEATRPIPVVLLSARAGEEARIQGLERGADDYVVKPFSARELLAWLSSQLALARLRRSDERRRTELYELFTQAPAPICVFRGDDLVFEMANPLYHRVYGREGLEGRPLLEAMPELRGQGLDDILHKVMRTREPHVGRETHIRCDRTGQGEVADTYWNFIYAPLTNAEGATDRVMGLCVEVTDQVLARRAAEAASRAKDEFLATLSHELRSPLNAIVGWTHLLRSRPDEATMKRAIETINRNAMAQSQLIADILDVQRLGSGKLRLDLKDVALVSVIEAALDTVRPAAEAKGVRLAPILDTSVAPVCADVDRLQQVVWNLLSNAIKFTPRGGRVQVRLLRVSSHVEIVVEDNGPGIEPAFLPYIFERFRQGDSSSTRRHGGVGLGLSIVRSLVELHGGTVHAANATEGTGAVFTVKLPRMSVAASASQHVQFERRSPTAEKEVWLDSAPSLHGTRVLVVDDLTDAREVVAEVLSRCGAEVLVATSAAEGLSLLKRDRPDVIVCDIEMPEQDGYAFIREVRRLSRAEGGATPAAALTAYASAEDRIRVLSAGFQMHVPKPVQPAELATVVASLAAMMRSVG